MKRCKEVMTSDPMCCLPQDTADRLAKLMRDENIGSVPICQDRHSKKLIGIVTDRDLALQIATEGRDPRSVRAQEVMTSNPITCRPDDDLESALQAMERHQVRRIPVVNNNSELVGIISQADVATRSAEPRKTAEMVEEISKPSGGIR